MVCGGMLSRFDYLLGSARPFFSGGGGTGFFFNR